MTSTCRGNRADPELRECLTCLGNYKYLYFHSESNGRTRMAVGTLKGVALVVNNNSAKNVTLTANPQVRAGHLFSRGY